MITVDNGQPVVEIRENIVTVTVPVGSRIVYMRHDHTGTYVCIDGKFQHCRKVDKTK